MRKYDKKNKRNIAIITAISIIIIIMFSLVIKLFLSIDKNEYTVSSNTIVFDKDKTMIKLNKEGIIKQKWNKEYYLIYNDENIELGDTAIAYNSDSGELHLYGRYYEISSGDEINITSGETIIKNTALTKFYKLADRKYLVVDKEIKTTDGLLTTSDFLMIDLDKVGNATLTNHKVSLKAFSETIIATSNYTFDIASEILIYGSDKIDLKKIIGSSNTYTKEDLIPEENSGEDSAASGNGSGDGEGTGGNETNAPAKEKIKERNETLIEEVKKESKNTSVVSVTSTTNKIVVDYVIYDPYNEYASVYIEFQKEGSNDIDIIYLKKDSTTYEITNNITPNTTYTLKFYYTYIDNNNNNIKKSFDTPQTIITKKPDINISISRMTINEIHYSITKEYNCNFTEATLKVINSSKGIDLYTDTIDLSGIAPNDSISLKDLISNEQQMTIEKGDTIRLVLTDIKVNGTIVKDLEASTKIKYFEDDINEGNY